MNRMKYTNSIEYILPDNYFTLEEKKLFLKIPHKIKKIQGQIEILDFKVPENGQYSTLNRIELVNITENLSEKNMDNRDIRVLLYSTSYEMEQQPGIYIKSQQGVHIFNLLQHLYDYDKENAQKLMEEYYQVSLNSDDITTICQRFIKDTAAMQNYLKDNNIIVPDYNIDYDSYLKLDSEEQKEKFVQQLEKKHGQGYRFEAYNDLDYTPIIVGNEYHIYDSASACLFVVRHEDNKQKIYKVYRDNISLSEDITDSYIREFAHEHEQYNILLSKTITEKDLIGEIENGILTKATSELLHMDLLQKFIVQQLREEGKIVYGVTELSFEELLKNHTLQHEFYHLEERSIFRLLKNLIIEEGKMTYSDFSSMDLNQKVKHEAISEHSLNDLNHGNSTIDLSHLKNLPNEYKEQISQYLEKLQDKYDNEYTTILCDYIKKNLAIQKKNKIK